MRFLSLYNSVSSCIIFQMTIQSSFPFSYISREYCEWSDFKSRLLCKVKIRRLRVGRRQMVTPSVGTGVGWVQLLGTCECTLSAQGYCWGRSARHLFSDGLQLTWHFCRTVSMHKAIFKSEKLFTIKKNTYSLSHSIRGLVIKGIYFLSNSFISHHFIV